MSLPDLFTINEPSAHDPGGKTLPMLPGMIGDAKFAGDNDTHRLWLSRGWGTGPVMLSIGMNPSTARHDVDDATIRRDIHFAQREGMGGFFKTNVCSYRATEPAEMARQGDGANHEKNIPTILHLASMPEVKLILVCYGVMPKMFQPHADQVVAALRGAGHKLWCLGRTLNGHPRHPLYLRSDTPLERF